MRNAISLIGTLLCGLAVFTGAVGAHAWKPTLMLHERLDTFHTAFLFHFFHGLAILVIGLVPNRSRWLTASFWFFLMGCFLFSLSLYVLALTNNILWATFAPFGGISFMLGWLFLMVHFTKDR